MSIGLPIKLLHEAEKHTVTIEIKSGEIYRGQLIDSEDNMNCQLSNVTVVHINGSQSKLAQAFIRGSKIRWVIVPDMLQNAPMFQKKDPNAVRGFGLRGRGGPPGRSRGSGMSSFSSSSSSSSFRGRR